ncbi:MAG TPA: xylulokinase, partial [Caldimonas sp.]|nr:xylulokinase [Caldimonas sp.]
RPAILWNDGRSDAECAVLEAAVPELHAIAGNLAMPGFTAPKLLWVRAHEPRLFERTARVLLPKDWLRLGLSGEHASDLSDASGTLWLDVAARDWSDLLLAACGLDRSCMPTLVEGSAPAGALRAALAARWGLPAGIPIAGGAGDNAASAVGVGAVRAGQGFVSLGTSGVVFLAGDRFRPNPGDAVHAFCHALPNRWHQMSVMLSAAGTLAWTRALFGLGSDAEVVERALSLDHRQRERAPIFLPYLSGERTPHNDADAQGVLFGLTQEHDARAVAYAALEGVGFGLRDGWRALRGAEQGVEQLSLVGGGARSAGWAQLLASTLGIGLRLETGNEAGAALGAARLARLADGGDEADVCRSGELRREFVPEPAVSTLLERRYARFRALYPALRESFATAAAREP